MHDKNRFDDSVVWYLNGSIDVENRALIERHAREDPRAEAQIRYWQAVREAVKDTVPERADDAGVDAFMRRLRQHASAVPVSGRTGLAAWLTEALKGLLRPRPGMAVAGLIVIAVQAGIIAGLLADRAAVGPESDAPAAMTRSLETSTPAAPFVKVRFKPGTSLRDIEKLLADMSGQIIAGPMQGGYYAIRLSDAEPAQAAMRIRIQGMVDDVILVEAPAPGKH